MLCGLPRANEEPRRFFIGEREVTIDAILDRCSILITALKVRGSDGGTYILRHDLSEDPGK